MNATVQSESRALAEAPRQQFNLAPQSFDQAITFADYLAASDLVPKDFKGKPGNCLIAVQWGAELGLQPLQAIQNIAIINGRPSLWGDVMLALVRASALCEYVVESIQGTVATCRVKRRGEPEQVREFTMEDAKTAGLANKDGPWKQYPKRMLQMRARAWALRDVFTDVLKGLHMAEEAMDMPPPGEKHMGTAEVVKAEVTQYPQADFDKNLPAWLDVIAKGRKTVDGIIAMANTKHPLTEEQQATIRARAKPPAPAEDATPKVTYAHVADLITKAATLDALADAADLIGSVADEKQRAELTTLHNDKQAALQPKE
jgi:hypothetical protein